MRRDRRTKRAHRNNPTVEPGKDTAIANAEPCTDPPAAEARQHSGAGTAAAASAVDADRRSAGAAVAAMSSEVIEAALYRAAEGNHAAEATTYILTEEGSFVRRADLFATCLDWSDDGRFASVQWHTLREMLTGANTHYPDGALRTMLLLCCALHDDGPAPLTRLSSLDTTNARIVARGIHIATGKMPLHQALGNTP